MAIADWIRVSLWPHTDWRRALGELGAIVLAEPTITTARLADLAHASELVEPDRRQALEMHERAWRLGHDPASLTRAFELIRELGDHDALASLALAAHAHTKDAAHLVTAAVALVDRGRAPEAEAPLAQAVAARPKDDEARSLLAMVKRQVRDPQAEISSWVARATRASGLESGRLYLQAARLARLAGQPAIHTRHVETAYQRGDPAAAMLVEADLLARRRAEDLLAFYRRRIEASSGDRAWADAMRAAGTKLIIANVQRGLAVRMLRSGLEGAYRARLGDIPGHLATWDLLARHARESQAMRELLPLLDEGMTRQLATHDDQLFLARLAIDLLREQGADAETARRRYQAIVDSLVPTADGAGDPPSIAVSPTEIRLVGPADSSTNPPHAVLTAQAVPELHATRVSVSAASKPAPPAPPVPKPAPPAPPVPKPAPPAPPVPKHAPPAPPVPKHAPPAAVSSPSAPVAAPTTPHAAATTLPVHAPPVASSVPVSAPASPAVALAPSVPAPASPPPVPATTQTPRAPRVVVPVDLQIRLSTGTVSALVRDLSATGVYVVTEQDIAIDEVVTLELELPSPGELAITRHVVHARVVRRAYTGYGMLFVDPAPDLVSAIAALGATT